MNRNSLPPVSKNLRLARWILLALLALAPLALLSQSQSAQKNRAGGEEKSAPEARKESGGAEEKAVDDETKRRLAAARTKAPGKSGLSPEPNSARAVGFAVSRPLAEVARRASKASRRNARVGEEEHEVAENEVTRVVSPQAQAEADDAVVRGLTRDTALQTRLPAPNMPAPTVSFEGLGRAENIAAGFGNFSPPDTNGDVGPNHYVQMDNLLVRVWNKAGTPQTAPFKLSSLFTSLGGQCAQPDRGDPLVLYDQLADRWMLSQFAYANKSAAPYHECIAVSKTGDPTGAYYLYDFVTPGNEFPDYPHLGVWPDGYYMMVHQFTNGGSFNGTGVYSFDRVRMLAGDSTASYIYFDLNRTAYPEAIGGMLPSDLDGLTPPPAGRPNTFVYFTTTDFNDPANGLRLFDFHADYATPANSTFTERAESTYAVPLAVAPFSIVTPQGGVEGRSAVPQPPPATSATGLDAITDRLMFRLQYRNRGGFETLVTSHTVGVPAATSFGTFRAAPRYYELRSTAGGPFVVQEQATFAPADGVSRWMGSAAEDNQGNLAVGYNVSSTTVFPGMRYAGRLATDPPGGLAQGEATLIAGTGVQTSTANRWGDYSALTVDPSDDCTFWYTGEYYTAAGQAASAVGWQTRIGSFKFAGCTAPAKGTAHFTVTNCTSAAAIANAVITIDGITYGVTATDGTFDATLAPGPHTYSITKAGGSLATGNFNVTDGNTTNVSDCIKSGTAHFVVTDCTAAANVGGAAVSIDGTAAGTTSAGGTLDVALTLGSHTYTITKVGYAPTSNSFNITDGNTTNVSPCLQGVPVIIANGASLMADANANGAVDPGEAVTVNFGLKNNGAGATSNLVATIQATGGVTSPGAPANYGVVAANGGTATQPISFTADAGLACGSTLTATLQLQDGMNDLGNVTYNFTLCPVVIVTATAGTTGPIDYATLKAAFDAINAGTHQGAVTVSINAGTTEGSTPATLNGSGAGSASYTSVNIRPVSDGVSVSGNPAGGLGVIQLNGASNVTIDGDNPDTPGTNRNLSVQNTASNTTTFNSVVRIALATTGATTANNDAIKNLIVLGSATGRNVSGATAPEGSQNTTYGIYAGAGSAGVTSAPSAVSSVSTTIGSPATASNLLIQNNSVNTAGRAIAVQGAATTVFPGLLIKDNVIGNPTPGAVDQVYTAGVVASGTADGRISGNTVYIEGFVASSSSSGANQAISLGTISNASTLTVEKNRVARVHNNAPDTWPAIGINMGGGNNHVVQNNFVYDIKNDQTAGFGGGGTGFGAYGIRAATGGGHKVYHNSVHLFGTLLGTTSTDLTAAFIIVSSSQLGIDVRNNVFSNQQTGGNPTTTNTRHTVIFLPPGASSTMNLTLNNNAYLQGPAVAGALSLLAKVGEDFGTGQFLAADFVAGATTPAANLRSYTSKLSAAGTNDNASLATTISPQFASDTDLHIPNGIATPLESGGNAVGVNEDIDGQTRPGPPGSVNGGGTAPDLGADEFDGGPPVVFPTPTPTPTPTPMQIVVNDARESEPTSGAHRMLYTVALSQPAPGGGISVNYATASGGATPATGGASCDGTSDYVTTSGTLVIPGGSRLGTVPVTVCADNVAAEPDETLLLNISGASSGAIAGAQATGTIAATSPPGTFVISELRTSGPSGSNDDFVELYNNTNSPLTVAASDASAGYGVYRMGADCNATPVLVAAIPNGTVIPARGHYLLKGSAYSLGSYAAGDQALASDIGDDQNVAVFTTANVFNLSTVTRLDGVGFGANVSASAAFTAGGSVRQPFRRGVRADVLSAAGSNGVCDLLREGNNLPAVSGSTTEHSFFRKECDFVGGIGCTANGNPKDSNDNTVDFMFADTQGTFISGVVQRLGAPGPENLFSPIRRDTSGIGAPLLDGSAATSAYPNRTRSFTSNPSQNSTFGTLTIRRRVVNSTGSNVTRLRFRIIDLTTFQSLGSGVADLRARTSVDEVSVGPINDATTCTAAGAGTPPCSITVRGLTLEQLPAQPNGGGFNSTLSAGTITLATPLANGVSLPVNFLLGIQTTGTFHFYIIVEALP
ncbi:MAG: hypothetical protein ACJ74T_14960 [Pyrinomonadaceae bacterium]